jgi:hypothetical protein
MKHLNRCHALVAIAALALSACVTANERMIPLAEVTGWKIADVQVAYPPTAAVNLENRTTAISLRLGGAELSAPAPLDPASPGRNLVQEKVMEMSSQPAVIAEARAGAASDIAQHFYKTFAFQPSGVRPVRLELEIVAVQDMGDQALLNVKAVFVDAKSGQTLLVNEGISHLRPSRRAQAVSGFIGGGVGGLIGVAIVASFQDAGRPPPFQDAVEETALKLRTWLLKPDGQR